MKRMTRTLILFSAAALCACATDAAAYSSGTASPASAQTQAFARTSLSPKVKAILAASKAAMGGAAWNTIHTLRVKGTVRVGGLKGSFNEFEDLSAGRSVQHFKLGPVAGASGFNGHEGWSKYPDGTIEPHDSPASRKADVTSAYQTARAWWFPRRWPAKIKPVDTRSDKGKTFQVLKITPNRGHAFQLWINANNHRIARTVDRSGTQPSTTYFSDYRSIHGVKIAFHQLTSSGGNRQAVHIKKVTVNVPVKAGDFAMPGQNLRDFSIIGGGSKVTVPFRLVSNHIVILAAVNGHQLNFVLDSGAGNILSPEAAKHAHVSGKGTLANHQGIGKKGVNMALGKVQKLTLGDKVELRNQRFVIEPLPRAATLYGLVGYQVLKRFVVRVDYAHRKLTFIKPSAFVPADAGKAVPLTISEAGVPLVKASIDGLSGEFEVDTGDFASIVLLAPFVKAHHLASRYRGTIEVPSAHGIGGAASKHAYLTRGGILKIGSFELDNPIVVLSTATKGAFANKHIVGNIGAEVLKRFTVTFDYPHHKIYFKPNKLYGMPMHFTRSGMGVSDDPHSHGFVVKSLMKGGPADKAGLVRGDVITEINGKPAERLGLDKARNMLLHGAPGTRVALTVKGGKTTHHATLVLCRLIPKTGDLKKAD